MKSVLGFVFLWALVGVGPDALGQDDVFLRAWSEASGVVVGAGGTILIADGGDNLVQGPDAHGGFVASWGGSGGHDGEFYGLYGTAPDSTGNVYATDRLGSSVQKLTPVLTVALSSLAPDPTQTSPIPVTVTFSAPVSGFTAQAIAVENATVANFGGGAAAYTFDLVPVGQGAVTAYIPANAAVDSNGLGNAASVPFGRTFDTVAPSVVSIASVNSAWPALSQPWNFSHPNGIAATSLGGGRVYVADTYDHRIRTFTPDGVLVKDWGHWGSGSGQFVQPGDVAVASAGTVYVADTGNDRVQLFTLDGTYVAEWGNLGSGDGQFNSPESVAVDSSGAVYVADTGNHRIQKFTSSGDYVTQWGGYGSGAGQFNTPSGVAVDSAGNVYVADTNNDRIQVFTTEGVYETQWGAHGTGAGQFRYPCGVTLDTSGNVIVSDTSNHRIQVFTSQGSYVTQWGSYGWGPGQLNYPNAVAVDDLGAYYVADTVNDRIQKFTSGGMDSAQWGSCGYGDGELNRPFGAALDSLGNVYVADTGNDRIQKFTGAGVYVTQWGSSGAGDGQFKQPYGVAVTSSGDVYVADTNNSRVEVFTGAGVYVTQWGSLGSGNGQFNAPRGVAAASSGKVYVADTNNSRIQVFDANGGYLTQWGGYGAGAGQFSSPCGIAVDDAGMVYVVDRNNLRVQKFTSDGTYVGQWGSGGTDPGQFDVPWGVAVSSAGTVYVADSYNSRIQAFTTDGIYLAQWGSVGWDQGQLRQPTGVVADAYGNVYVADPGNNRVCHLLTGTTAAALVPVTVTFSENVTGFTAGDVSVVNGVVSDFSGSGTTYTFNVIPSEEGGITVEVAAGVGTDAAGNTNTSSETFSVVYDSISPGVSLSSSVSDSTNNSPIPVTATFTEPVIGFEAADISVSNGTVANFTGSGTSYRFDLVPAGQGVVSAAINADVCTDLAGNPNVASAPFQRTYDLTAPTVVGMTAVTRQWPTLPGSWYFDGPRGVAITAFGRVYVTDTGNNRILTLSTEGVSGAQWGSYGTGPGEFDGPNAVAVDESGNVYVTDAGNNRVQKFGGDGAYLTEWGGYGGGAGQFSGPAGLAVSASGDVYVADSGNNRIEEFTSSGAFVRAWGSAGTGDGQFNSPEGVAVDSSGNVYVADMHNARIQVFTATGDYVAQWNGAKSGKAQLSAPAGIAVDSSGYVYVVDSGAGTIQKFTTAGAFLASWGGLGSGAGELDAPTGLALDGSGAIYVADTYNHRIEVFTPQGVYATQWASYGSGAGEFAGPGGVALDSVGRVYVADTNNHRIQVFTPSGGYLTQWGEYGTGNGQFQFPYAVAIGPTDRVYVSDTRNDRIQIFTAAGGYVGQWGSPGSAAGQFNNPIGVAVGGNGHVYVADMGNNRVQEFSPVGVYVGQWGAGGVGDGEFSTPFGVSCDPAGTIYVADTGNNRVQEFSLSGAYLGQWGGIGTGAGQFDGPTFLAVGPLNTVYVTDTNNDRIQAFSAGGVYFGQWGGSGFMRGQFHQPTGSAVDRSGGVYVSDWGNNRLCYVATSLSNATVIPLTVTFSEAVTGFGADGIAVTNGTVTSIRGSGASYVVEITPSGQGIVTASIRAGACTDAAGNASSAGSAFSLSYDSVRPIASMSSSAADPTNSAPIPVTVTFSEPVLGFDAGGITATNGSVTDFSGSGQAYTFNLNPLGQGAVRADIVAGAVYDMAGNTNLPALTFSRTYDTVGPSVSVVSATLEPTAMSPIPVEVAFGEPVTGFTVDDVTVSNAAVSNFSGSGASYTFDLTPNPPFPCVITVSVAAGVALDAAGNPNTASAVFTRTYDPTPATGSLSGVAQDFVTGTRLICATVRIYSSERDVERITVVNLEGEYHAQNLPVGQYLVEAYATGYDKASRLVTIVTGEERRAHFGLHASTTSGGLRGVVSDADSGLPLAGARVNAIIGGLAVATTYTCAEGRYQLTNLVSKSATPVTVEFSAPNYETKTEEVEVVPDQTREVSAPLTLKSLMFGALAGVIRDASNGQPLGNAQVVVSGPIGISTDSALDGSYHFDVLPAGTYTVAASACGFEEWAQVVGVAASDVQMTDISLTPGAPEPPFLEDIDGTRWVDAVDVQLVINQALGLVINGDADVNRDGRVDAVDVQLVINAALGIH